MTIYLLTIKPYNMPAQTITDRAGQIVNELNNAYLKQHTFSKVELDFWASQWISGDHNKELRREIIRLTTGQTRPLSKCGLYAVTDELKSYYDSVFSAFVLGSKEESDLAKARDGKIKDGY